MAQIVADHRVDISQIEGRILTGDLLRGGTLVERLDDSVKRNPRATDTNDAFGVRSQRQYLGPSLQGHRLFSFPRDYTVYPATLPRPRPQADAGPRTAALPHAPGRLLGVPGRA